jgi:DNA replicative helicase MCM subunit Mcm2 (Cdc46/Mcm family)
VVTGVWQEEERFIALARSPDVYERLAASIAPSISGDYTVDIKKALVCQLMGGSRKVIPEAQCAAFDINHSEDSQTGFRRDPMDVSEVPIQG